MLEIMDTDDRLVKEDMGCVLAMKAKFGDSAFLEKWDKARHTLCCPLN